MGRRLPHHLVLTWIIGLGFLLAGSTQVHAGGKVGWLDDVVRQVVREAGASRHVENRVARSTARLFAAQADESLSSLARRLEPAARAAGKIEEPSEAALRLRFQRLVKPDAEMARAFGNLAPAERRLVVELGESAAVIARRAPSGEAEATLRALGLDGLAAVRTYGDNVAETLIKEGPEALNVLRKTGRPGWRVYTEIVLQHKKKLAAAGVLTLFLANPDQFVDTTGKLTQYAVDHFTRAGIQLAGAMGGGAARGAQSALEDSLSRWGLHPALVRGTGIGIASLLAIGALLVLMGLPLRLLLWPVLSPLNLLRRLLRLGRAMPARGGSSLFTQPRSSDSKLLRTRF
jgi:hypothetical protein